MMEVDNDVVGDARDEAVTKGRLSPLQRFKAVMEPMIRRIGPTKPKNAAPSFTKEIDYELLKSEAERLKTFDSWSVNCVNPKDLAKAGFFSMHNGNRVKCAFCRGVVGEWVEGDVPMTEHKKIYPRCPFICDLPVGNIPLVDDKVVEAQPSNPTPASLGIAKCSGPSNKSMVSESSRLKSFKEMKWPASTGQTPETLASAGFYYVGNKDHVKCFYCGGGLKNWISSDNPMQIHAKWFPHCIFICLNKTNSNITLQSTEQFQKNESLSCTSETPATAPTNSKKILLEELKRLREQRLCKVCKEKDATIVYLPCGHLASCADCSKICKNCNICQQPIKAILRTFS